MRRFGEREGNPSGWDEKGLCNCRIFYYCIFFGVPKKSGRWMQVVSF